MAELTNRELDALIAEKVTGLVPCDEWKPINFGSAGGPALMNSGCSHGKNKCYSRVEISGGINGMFGGPPKYSTDLNACREAELEMRRHSHQWSAYVQEMCRRVGSVDQAAGLIEADARTRCLAMLKVREEKP